MDFKRLGIAGAGRAAGEVGQVVWMDIVEMGFRLFVFNLMTILIPIWRSIMEQCQSHRRTKNDLTTINNQRDRLVRHVGPMYKQSVVVRIRPPRRQSNPPFGCC